jgi:hypothetical protein
MGCGPSSEHCCDCCGLGHHEAPPPPKPRPNIGRPTDVSIHIPRNRADEHGVPLQQVSHEVDRASLENALDIMAAYLHEKHKQLTVIAVGGAVNTIFLRTRNSTHDVDIFGSNLGNQDRILLDEAMHHAREQSTTPLGTDWFNTENQMWMTSRLHKELTNEAIEQNAVVYNQPGLTVLAAPWEYAFSGKISRLLKGGDQVRPYDVSDAVHYLDIYIKQGSGQPVPVTTIEGWAKRFGHTTKRSYLLNEVNAKYKAQYKGTGIVE